MATTDALSLASDLETIRNLTGDLLILKYQQIPPSQQLRHEFIVNLETHEREIAYKGCLLLYTITNGAKVPREFQLEATLALLAGRDSLINAGTGSGKTLCMALPALLDPTSVSLVTKQLQILQVTCVGHIYARI
jgi:superfamily II DNA or RNA helicase